jgi:SnoaL-like polyketide cyclase
MSIEENKKLVRRYCEEVFDQGKLDLIDEFLAPDPSYGPDYLENKKRKFAESRAALSDVSFHVEDMIAEGDKIVVRGTFEDVATMLLYGPPEQLVVADQRCLHGRCIALPEFGGTFYVSEKKGESACRRAGHHLYLLLASLERTL